MIIQPTNGSRFIGGRRLPNEYQEVEYIATTTVSPYGYIDIGLKITKAEHSLYRFVDDMRANYVSTSYVIVGTSSYNYHGIQRYSSDGKYYFVIGSGSKDAGRQFEVSNNTRHLYDIDYTNGTYKFDDISGTFEVTELDAENKYYLFGTNSTGRPQIAQYHSKIYKSGTKIYDLIPCYRKSDDVAGMFCILHNQFYENLRPSAPFLVGNAIY